MIAVRHALDRATGRVTMYRLVTITLLITAVAAVLLSLVGQVSFTAPALLASLGAALIGAIGSNIVVALVLRSKPHSESALITGLLVFFLLFPSTEPRQLGIIALAGVIATVSKYVLAWRGRHILNPAAAGVAVIALLQLDAAVWWVATPALLPFTLVGGFLVLYRTGRIPMALLFILVGGILVSAQLIGGGQDAADAVVRTLTSYPLVFFAAFMLSEPLTLPPRRWQQFVLAAVVGVLFAVPLDLGPVLLSYEIALLMGNALAFAAGQRRGLRLDYVGSRQLTPTAWEFRFQPDHPVAFRPGQYMELTLPHSRQDPRGARRVFSIASAPDPGGPVAFAMRMPQVASTFKRALVDLKPGTRVRGTSVGGDFLLPRDRSTPLLLVAGGIGITPFLSQLAYERATGSDRDIVLVYSVGSVDELAFTEELVDEHVLLVCPDPPSDLAPSWRWIGDGPITGELLQREVGDLASRAAFVSGAPAVVTDVRAALKRLGVRKVATDYFSGY